MRFCVFVGIAITGLILVVPQSQDALLASVESAGIAARVINTPTAFIEDADGNIPPGAEQRINDFLFAYYGQRPDVLKKRQACFAGSAGASGGGEATR